MKAGLEKAQQLSGFAHSVPQTPELCCNPVTCHEAADVAEAMGREARGVQAHAFFLPSWAQGVKGGKLEKGQVFASK